MERGIFEIIFFRLNFKLLTQIQCSSINGHNRFKVNNICVGSITGSKTVAMQLLKKIFGVLNER